MKIYENKKLFKKVIWFLLILIIVSFCFTGEVNAKDNARGGKLLKPIVQFITFFGDALMNIVHGVLFKQWDTTITTDLTLNAVEIGLSIVVGVVTAVIIGAAVIITAGAVVAALAGIGVTLASVGVGTVVAVSVGAGIWAGAAVFNSDLLPDVIELPVYQISPEEIFSNDILLLDVDFFNPKSDKVLKNKKGEVIKDDNGNPYILESTAKQLREVISNWYIVLRDIAIVALLSILVYIGIRILISSTSNDKAKYRQMLVDWIVALCLLFTMQYIMSFANLAVGKVTDVLNSAVTKNSYNALVPDKNGKISKRLTKLGYNTSELQSEAGGINYISWETNLLGVARLNAQMGMNQSSSYAGYGFIFLVLVLFTIYFLFTYLKRVLYMAFLTIIAPLVAMTYPLDKINDGKAQAFNMWFKEYIFNLLIQPMHLILYTILVSSAFKLASENIIYSLVAIGFMVPSEKLLRKFFGFEKAQTPGLLAGPAGAAMTMEAMKHLFGKPPKGMDGKTGNSKGTSDSGNDTGKSPKFKNNFDNEDAFFGTEDNNSSQNNDKKNDTTSNNYAENDDNVIDLSEDEYSIKDVNDDSQSENSTATRANNYAGNGGLPGPTEDNDNVADLSEDEYSINDESEDSKDNNSKNNNSQNNNKVQNNKKSDNEEEKKDENRVKKSIRNQARSVIRPMRYAGSSIRHNVAKAAKNKIKNAHPVRFAAGVASGAAFGAIGLAAGVASGDLSKAAQYTTAAATGGYKFGTGTAKALGSFLPDDMHEVAERSRYENDDDYEAAKQEKYIEEFQKNNKNKFELERVYGKEESKRIMEEDIPMLIRNGITDIDDIKAVEDLVKDDSAETKKITTIKKAIATKNMAGRVGNTNNMKADDQEKWRNTLKKDYDNSPKWKDRDTEQMSKDAMDAVKAYNRIRFK